MWRLSGIHRDVRLLVKPAVHITDLTVRTPLSFARPAGPPCEAGAGGTVAAELCAAGLEVGVEQHRDTHRYEIRTCA